jgi:hypothetical protein
MNNTLKRDMACIQELVGNSFTQTGGLVALADGGQMSPEKLQRRLEKTTEEFERATLELRRLCEQYAPGVGGYGAKPVVPPRSLIGHVDMLDHRWLHIQLNTLLPHCRYQAPTWLSDTIRRLLDDYERQGNTLPFLQQAFLIIDEHSSVDGRHVYDQDNKGWKAVSNAIKGRLIPDDDQYTLGVVLLSKRSEENICHISLVPRADAAEFLSLHSGEYAVSDFYGGEWS